MLQDTIKISAIVAMDEKRGIAKKGKIPWYIPEDLRRFKEVTTGHVVIMGRKTWGTLGKPLKNRTNIVITREKHYKAPGCIVAHSLHQALSIAKSKEKRGEIFIIGGGQIYNEALPQVDKLYVTIVKGDYGADTFFPDYSEFDHIISKENRSSSEYQYTYLVLTRQKG